MKKVIKKWWFWGILVLVAVIITRAVMVAKALKKEKIANPSTELPTFWKSVKAFFTLPVTESGINKKLDLKLGVSETITPIEKKILGRPVEFITPN